MSLSPSPSPSPDAASPWDLFFGAISGDFFKNEIVSRVLSEGDVTWRQVPAVHFLTHGHWKVYTNAAALTRLRMVNKATAQVWRTILPRRLCTFGEYLAYLLEMGYEFEFGALHPLWMLRSQLPPAQILEHYQAPDLIRQTYTNESNILLYAALLNDSDRGLTYRFCCSILARATCSRLHPHLGKSGSFNVGFLMGMLSLYERHGPTIAAKPMRFVFASIYYKRMGRRAKGDELIQPFFAETVESMFLNLDDVYALTSLMFHASSRRWKRLMYRRDYADFWEEAINTEYLNVPDFFCTTNLPFVRWSDIIYGKGGLVLLPKCRDLFLRFLKTSTLVQTKEDIIVGIFLPNWSIETIHWLDSQHPISLIDYLELEYGDLKPALNTFQHLAWNLVTFSSPFSLTIAQRLFRAIADDDDDKRREARVLFLIWALISPSRQISPVLDARNMLDFRHVVRRCVFSDLSYIDRLDTVVQATTEGFLSLAKLFDRDPAYWGKQKESIMFMKNIYHRPYVLTDATTVQPLIDMLDDPLFDKYFGDLYWPWCIAYTHRPEMNEFTRRCLKKRIELLRAMPDPELRRSNDTLLVMALHTNRQLFTAYIDTLADILPLAGRFEFVIELLRCSRHVPMVGCMTGCDYDALCHAIRALCGRQLASIEESICCEYFATDELRQEMFFYASDTTLESLIDYTRIVCLNNATYFRAKTAVPDVTKLPENAVVVRAYDNINTNNLDEALPPGFGHPPGYCDEKESPHFNRLIVAMTPHLYPQ